MKRLIAMAAIAAVGVACGLEVGPLHAPNLVLTPVLDSMFVGDQLLRRQATYFDEHGTAQNPGVVTWSSNDSNIASVDKSTGKITGRAPGIAAIFATAQGVESFAVIAVSAPLKLTVLIDTLYMMPGDTFTVPVEARHEAPGNPLVWC